jgi:hypothetical protein
MKIITDKRIELITIIQTLCNYWDNLVRHFSDNPLYQCKYKENVKEYFEIYREHKVLKLYDSLCNDIKDISTFLNLALCYSSPPEFECIANYENNFGKINDSTFPYEEFINGLKQFYIDTDFERFYKNSQNEYIQMLNDFGNKSELSVNIVLGYLKSNIDNYNIIISPLVMGSFGIKVKTNKNEILNYSVISPNDYKENKYVFGSIDFKKSYLWHEICHLTINDLTRKYINQFNTEKKQISEIFTNNFYTNTETIINEYIIRAITIRLFEIIGEKNFIRYLIEDNIQKGFNDIEVLKNYIKENCEENNKLIKGDNYKNLMEYVISKI